jgi:hypothetical protein
VSTRTAQRSILSLTQWRTHDLVCRRAREIVTNCERNLRTSVNPVKDVGIDLDVARAVREVVILAFRFLISATASCRRLVIASINCGCPSRLSRCLSSAVLAPAFVSTFMTDVVVFRTNPSIFMGCTGERRDARFQGLGVEHEQQLRRIEPRSQRGARKRCAARLDFRERSPAARLAHLAEARLIPTCVLKRVWQERLLFATPPHFVNTKTERRNTVALNTLNS